MHFENILRVGLVALVLAMFGVGWEGLPFIVAAVVILPLAWLQRRVSALAKDDLDARRAHALVVGLQVLTALVLVWARPVMGTLLLATSGVLNMIPLVANGLRMPFEGHTSNPCYVKIGPSTRFRWLGDIFHTTRTNQHHWLFSFGDILELLAVWAIAAHLFVRIFE